MSLLDRLNTQTEEAPAGDPAVAQAQAQTEAREPTEAEILGLTEDTDVLSEMMGGMHVSRYVNHRDLQYALEDAATTCERSWKDRKGYKEHKGLADKHKALIECLRDCSKKAGTYADGMDAARDDSY